MENHTMEQNKESVLERIAGFAKEFFSKPWIYSSSEENYSLPKTRRRIYEAMSRYT